MTKTVLNQSIAEGAKYVAPSCEAVCLSSDCAVLNTSTGSFTIQDWSDEAYDDELTV